MKKLASIWLMIWTLGFIAFGQQPQTQNAPIYSVNAKYTNGVAPGYWPTQQAVTATGPGSSPATGLNINLGPGTSNCSGTIEPYAGGVISLTASVTNYIYLNTSASCAPAVKTTAFTSSDIPLAVVVAGSSTISSITDDRTMFFIPSTGGGSGTVTSVALVGSANFFKNTPGTPVTGSGNLNLDSQLLAQVANCILAGPASGSSVAPTCRSMVAADLPSVGGVSGSYTCTNTTVDSHGRITAASSGSCGGGGSQSPTFPANTDIYLYGDSRLIVASTCRTGARISGTITAGSSSSNNLALTTSNDLIAGDVVTLSQFTGSYTGLNGQEIVLSSSGLSGSGFQGTGPGVSVPDGSTGAGAFACSNTATQRLATDPALPSSSHVYNIAQPNESLSNSITNYSTLIHPYTKAVTGRNTIFVLQIGWAESLAADSAVTQAGLYQQLWALIHADQSLIIQQTQITGNGPSDNRTPWIYSAPVNTWLIDQGPQLASSNQASSILLPMTNDTQHWDLFDQIDQLFPDPNNEYYFIQADNCLVGNCGDVGHLTDEGNSQNYFDIKNILISNSSILRPNCNGYNDFACNGAGVGFYNMFVSNEMGVSNSSAPVPNAYWIENSSGDITFGTGVSPPVVWYNFDTNVLVSSWSANVVAGWSGTYFSKDASVAGQQDLGNGTVGDTSGGLGLKWIYPNLATAPTGSCTGTPVGYYPSRDKQMSYCDGSVWSQPFTVLPSCGIYNIPCTNTPNTFSGGTQTVITSTPTTPAIIEQGTSGLLTPVIVQATNSSGSFPSNVTTGNTIIAFCNTNPQSFTDNLGNVYSNIASLFNSFFQYPVVFLATNITGGSVNLAPCYGSSNQQVAYEISGLASSPVDAIDLNVSYLASTNTRTVTTTQAGDLLVAGILTSGNGTTNAPATPSFGSLTCNTQGGPPGGDCGSALSAKMAPTVATYSSTWSGLSSADFGFLVALKAGSSSGQISDLHQYKASSSIGGALLGGVNATGLPYMVPVLYSALPGSPQAGQLAIISDASGTPAWGGTAAGSGTPANSTTFEVMYNGTNWIYQ